MAVMGAYASVLKASSRQIWCEAAMSGKPYRCWCMLGLPCCQLVCMDTCSDGVVC